LKIQFYITQFDQVKDATKIYLEIINEAFTGSKELNMVSNIKDITEVNYVITFTVTDFFRLKIRKPKTKIIHWYQGIIPEEAKLKTNSIKQYIAFSLLERFVLKFADFNFFVSKAMQKHFESKYNFNKNNYFLMPCFNGEIYPKQEFFQKNYKAPEFVYIGSMATWQCVDNAIKIFKIVKQEIPAARLTLLTNQQEKAKLKLEKFKVKANVSYVSLNNISKELLKYKYGFLLRDDIAVNNVATPTKMSTYLASGVIPIYTEVIKAFKVFNNIQYQIRAENNNSKKIAEQIIQFEKNKLFEEKIYEEYNSVFETYYNKEKYIKAIKKIFEIQ